MHQTVNCTGTAATAAVCVAQALEYITTYSREAEIPPIYNLTGKQLLPLTATTATTRQAGGL